MIEIAALLTIKSAVPGVDPLPVAGAGIAETQDFGSVLAETVDAAVLAAPLPDIAPPELRLEIRRQPDGKSLPEALPDRQEVPVDQSSEPAGAIPVSRVVGRVGKARLTAISATLSPLKAQPAPAGEAERKPATPFAPNQPESDMAEAVPDAIVQPVVPFIQLTTGRAAIESPRPVAGLRAPPRNPAQVVATPVRLPALPAELKDIGIVPHAAPEVRLAPLAAPQLAVETFAVKIAVAPPEVKDGAVPARTPSSPTAILPAATMAVLPAPAVREIVIRARSKPAPGEQAAPPAAAPPASGLVRERDDTVAVSRSPEMPAGAVLPKLLETIAPNPVAAPSPAAPEPRQDFAALVERLIASRTALSPEPVHTALAHTEFGEVTFRFAHDDAGLSVAMASADPDFAPAVQAAMPAERSEAAGEDRPRGQPSPGQSATQTMADQRGANHAAPQPRAAHDRNSRPDPGATLETPGDDGQRKRAGIFA